MSEFYVSAEQRRRWEQAIKRWGGHAQITMGVEECAETIQALTHYERGREDIRKVVDELGDAIVCVGQVIHSECGHDHSNTQRVIAEAIDRAFDKLQLKLQQRGEDR